MMEAINIVKTTQHEDIPTLTNFIQEPMQLHNMLAFPYIPARPTQGREPLMDYSRSHVVISIQYFGNLAKEKN
jgi:hypothetical protein